MLEIVEDRVQTRHPHQNHNIEDFYVFRKALVSQFRVFPFLKLSSANGPASRRCRVPHGGGWCRGGSRNWIGGILFTKDSFKLPKFQSLQVSKFQSSTFSKFRSFKSFKNNFMLFDRYLSHIQDFQAYIKWIFQIVWSSSFPTFKVFDFGNFKSFNYNIFQT